MVKILDCTLRDGGLVNDSNFSDEFARAVLRACESESLKSDSEIPKNSFRPKNSANGGFARKRI